MADLASTRVFGNLKVTGVLSADGSGLTGTASLRATGTTKADVGLGSVDNYSRAHYDGRYLAAGGKAVDSDKLDGKHASAFASASHTHGVADISGLSDAATTSVSTIRSGTTKANVGLGSVRNVASHSQSEANAAFAEKSHSHSLSQITGAGNLASLSTNSSTSNFLRGDGTWVTPPNTNTTYSEISTAEIDAGTASTRRTISGRRMKYALDKKADTSTQVIAGTGLSGGGTLAANRTLSVDSTVVRTTGNQSIGGTKTFTAPIYAKTDLGTYSIGGGTGDYQTMNFTSRSGNLTWYVNNADVGGLEWRVHNEGSGFNNRFFMDFNNGDFTASKFIGSGSGLTGTAPSLRAQATTAADVGAPPTSRTITAGTGLSGGGNLTANRTLSVKYGTSAGTAAQGNDSRLSNSRDWTASVVSQAEAQAGTATTSRKWTSQRVRQAITGWWSGATSEWGRGFVSSSDAAAGRTALGLGNAATTTVASIRSGTTKANVGLGNVLNVASYSKTEMDDILDGVSFSSTWADLEGKPLTYPPSSHTHTVSQISNLGQNQGVTNQDPNLATDHVILTNHANSPPGSSYWHITTTFYNEISSTGNRAQLAIRYNGTPAQAYVRQCFSNAWTPWVACSNNLVTKANVGLGNVRNVASYSQSESNGRYFSASGGTMNGFIHTGATSSGIGSPNASNPAPDNHIGHTLRMNSGGTPYFSICSSGAAIYAGRPSNGIVISLYRSGARQGGIDVSTTGVTYNSLSDYRLKEDIQPLDSATNTLKALKPCSFVFKTDESATPVQGFIAHELQEVVPQAVTGEKDGVDEEGNPDYQGVDAARLVPLLTKALQEAVDRIEVLEEKLNRLEESSL